MTKEPLINIPNATELTKQLEDVYVDGSIPVPMFMLDTAVNDDIADNLKDIDQALSGTEQKTLTPEQYNQFMVQYTKLIREARRANMTPGVLAKRRAAAKVAKKSRKRNR